MSTKTISQQVHTIDTIKETNKKLYDRIICKYRDINTDHNWYENIYDEWQKKLFSLGYENAKIWFSGFSSQGDGACFDAKINSKVLLPLYPEADLSIEKIGHHYCHEGTRKISIDSLSYWNNAASCWTNYELTEEQEKELRIKLTENYRALCREIYRELEREFYYLQSDEAVYETLLANEYYFNSKGDIES